MADRDTMHYVSLDEAEIYTLIAVLEQSMNKIFNNNLRKMLSEEEREVVYERCSFYLGADASILEIEELMTMLMKKLLAEAKDKREQG